MRAHALVIAFPIPLKGGRSLLGRQVIQVTYALLGELQAFHPFGGFHPSATAFFAHSGSGRSCLNASLSTGVAYFPTVSGYKQFERAWDGGGCGAAASIGAHGGPRLASP